MWGEKSKMECDLKNLFKSSTIQDDFCNIWTNIIEKVDDIDISAEDALESVKDLVLYDILDGSRTTLPSKSFIGPEYDAPLFSIALINVLQTLGAKSCVIMLHTSYNRERGEKEFKRILQIVKSGAELIKQYFTNNDIRSNCLCINKNYKLIDLLREVEQQTQDGLFNAYFLFDYNEKWSAENEGHDVLDKLPDIDVYIRHTKFQPSGGWIPDKMKKSAFLYSQNGTTLSNWQSDELVALVALAVLAKKFNEGEGLDKTYSNNDEIQRRYRKREVDLFQKTIRLREQSRKLFILGSPMGTYQVYY